MQHIILDNSHVDCPMFYVFDQKVNRIFQMGYYVSTVVIACWLPIDCTVDPYEVCIQVCKTLWTRITQVSQAEVQSCDLVMLRISWNLKTEIPQEQWAISNRHDIYIYIPVNIYYTYLYIYDPGSLIVISRELEEDMFVEYFIYISRWC